MERSKTRKRIERCRERKGYYIPRPPSKRKPMPLSYSRFAYLPNDVMLLILDVLSCRDILKATKAIQLPVSDDYWRLRATQNLFEIDDLGDVDHDWPYLASKMEELYKNDRFFRTRRYIHDILYDMKPLYVANLKNRTFPSLEDVIHEMQDEKNRGHRSLPEST